MLDLGGLQGLLLVVELTNYLNIGVGENEKNNSVLGKNHLYFYDFYVIFYRF